jgi:hypothetical protein
MNNMFRKQKRFFLLAVCIGIGFCLISCAASSQNIVKMPVTTKLALYKNVTVSVTNSTANPIDNEERNLLVKELCMQLELTGKFQQVNASDQSGQKISELLVETEVVNISRVNRATRIMLGAMAGQASLELQVKLIDSKEQKVIGQTNTIGYSSGGNIFAETTEGAIKQAAKGVADFVVSNY